MEAFPKSSWFLLLLGFSVLAATLQEHDGDCPSPDKVSCTTGVKCNSDEDCDKDNICCANSCYTKRCTPNLNGVQGAADSDGPTESECRPYIEKALKELTETGEAKPGSAEEEDSVEDLPTVEITTDDSTEQVGGEADTDDDAGAASEETENVSDEKTQTAVDDAQSEEGATEEQEEGKDESIETTQNEQEPTREESKEDGEPSKESDQEDKAESAEAASAEKAESKEEQTLEGQEASAESVEVNIEAPTLPAGAGIPVTVADEESEEAKSAEDQAESKEDAAESAEEQQDAVETAEAQTVSAEAGEESAEDDATKEESAEEEKDSKEGGSVEDETNAKESKEVETSKEEKEKSDEKSEEKKGGEQVATAKADSAEETGCPSKDKVSCTEGTKCYADKDCKKNHVCCPNKCYTSRCIKAPGVESGEDDDEESAEEQPAAKSEEKEDEKSAESGEATGCPAPEKVSCTEGTLCNTHASCQETEICCLNKCYRKRCVEGELAEGEERGEPSAEQEKSEEKEQPVQAPVPAEASSGCPPKSQVPCKDAEKCNKHSHCKPNEICCPNNCYGRRCVEGELASGEERGEESEEDKSEEKPSKVKSEESGEKTGCPSIGKVSCHEGTLCGKHADCEDNEICCPNKCYKRRCIEGELAEGEERGEKSEEEPPQAAAKADSKESGEKTGCPASSSVPCGGANVCAKHKECGSNEICCPNKCYRKQCVEGELAPGEGDEESEESEEVPPKPAPKPQPRPAPVPISSPPPPPKKEEPKTVEAIVKEEIVAKIEKKPEPKVVREPREIKIVEKKPSEDSEEKEESHVEDLTADDEAPTELRSRDHVEQLLKLDDESTEKENIINRVAEVTLKELKRLYENAIKPLEVLYKYRDLSNRHFGDPEIFSKPLVLFMGPWSGGKSSIINYLTNNEYNETSLRTGAEPSPAYFNILMHGDEPEVIDGTQLAADFTFSGLQKFGQGLEERLRGVKLPVKLLEKVNIVEIPGILEVRKQVSRLFPFNDACQWFIDRADIIFLVYDPSKLDVGPETEAILDQLKGREHQTRIILNKADQVKPEELMRVQGALIWNISPLMSSPQPPVMYTTSLWSKPYESWAPARLLQAQERAFLRDLRSAVDKRIENKIASARRFAVRVRNHAKMVDCYLTTYYNHKSVFGNRKQVADEIIEHPQDYHIYEGLSTLTNISRYDLPDPDVYKDFFKLNPLYDFQQLSATCTYFRGCPINRLDVAIAYDLPELVGNHKKLVEEALTNKDKPKEEKSKPKSSQKTAPGS